MELKLSVNYLQLIKETLKKDRNKDSIPMKDALSNYFKAMGMEDKINETRVLSQWGDIMGEAIAKRTEDIYIKDEKLFIRVNSSVIRDELQQQKAEIIKKLNTIAGRKIISEIFLK